MQRIMTFLRKAILDNKKKIAVIALVLLLTTFVLYNMNSYRLKGELPYSAQDKGFVDENFYRCVIDNYNDFRGTSLTEYDDLPRGAKEMTALECVHDNIREIKGIEYFTNLKSINLRGNNINNVNFRSNKLLEEIDLSHNSLYGLDLEYNTNLKSINLNKAFESDVFQDITIKKGDVKNLGLHVYLPSGYDVKYVYDESIISFDGNDITGLSSGTTTLNAENDTFGYLFSFKVNVIEDESEPLKVTLDDYDWSIIDGYIYTQYETNKDTILNNIKVNKGEVSYTNDNYDEIQITYDNNTLATYKIANFSSDTYIFTGFDEGPAIYVLNENIDQKYLNLKNCEIVQDGLDVYVKINGKRVEKLRAIFIYSDKHDLLKDYILFENNDQNDIKVKSYFNAKLFELKTEDLEAYEYMVKQTDDEIILFPYDEDQGYKRTLKKLRINFDGYEVVDGVINTTKKNDDFASVTTTNCEKEVKDGKLLVKYNGEIIKTYTINVVDKNIVTTTKKEEDKTEDKTSTTKEVSKNDTTTNKKIDDFIPKTESDTTTTKTTTRIEDKYNAIDAKLRSLSKRNSNRNIIILLLSLTAVILSFIIVNMLLKIKKSKKK